MNIQPFSVDPIRLPTDFTEFDRPRPERVDVAGCENCAVSRRVQTVLAEALLSSQALLMDHWQSQDGTLRSKLSALHQVEPENIFLTSGALGGIDYSFQVCVQEGTRVGLLSPDFSGFLHHAERRKADIRLLKRAEFPFAHEQQDVDAFLREQEIDFLITSNPSAAIGTKRSAEEIEQLLQSHPQTLFVIDEADALETDSVSHLTSQYDNLIVLRSFSKYYGLSGLRVGYLVCPQSLREHFARTINPVELTSVGILAATEVLDDEEYLRATQERVKANLALLEQACVDTPYTIVPGSECFAVYITADEGEEDPFVYFQRHGIAIAPAQTFGLTRGGRINISNPTYIARVAEVIASAKKIVKD